MRIQLIQRRKQRNKRREHLRDTAFRVGPECVSVFPHRKAVVLPGQGDATNDGATGGGGWLSRAARWSKKRRLARDCAPAVSSGSNRSISYLNLKSEQSRLIVLLDFEELFLHHLDLFG